MDDKFDDNGLFFWDNTDNGEVIIIDLVGVPNSLSKTKEKSLINDIKKLNNQV